jgi:hypothetical protein
MSRFIICLVTCGTVLYGADALSGARSPSLTGRVETGFADTFQLTLGGTFGAGPAWHNRVSVAAANAFRSGDTVTFSGFYTADLPSHARDWTAALGYKMRVLRGNRQQLTLGASIERWRLPSVLAGAQDWILGGQASYTRTIRGVPLTVQSVSWTHLHSPLPQGSLVHTTAWFSHPLKESRWLRLTLRHGPQHTYSWGFYGTRGHRVVRYASALVLSHGRTDLELGCRQQLGLQPRIPDNRLWHAALSQTF